MKTPRLKATDSSSCGENIPHRMKLPMDLQVVLIFILALLTLNLMFVGFYVVIVLKEFRQTIKKSNAVLDDVSQVTNSVANPISSLVGVVTGIAETVKSIKSISSIRDEDYDEEDL